jgi:hypothetical protein
MVELAFPWEVLGKLSTKKAPPSEGDQWRVNFSRVQWQIEIKDGKYHKVKGKKEDNWVWSPQGVVDMHRPEKWGYVQFTRRQPGEVSFVPDVSAPARTALQEIYYAQRTFRRSNRSWAEKLTELTLASDLAADLAKPLELESTSDGYRATATVRGKDGKLQAWHIRQDGKVWSEQP